MCTCRDPSYALERISMYVKITPQLTRSSNSYIRWADNKKRCYTNVLERVDPGCGFLDLTPNNLRNQLGSQLRQSATGSFALDDLNHLLTDGADLGRLRVGGLLDLIWPPLGEGNGKKTEEVLVGGLDSDVGFDQCLPLAHERAKLV